MLVFKRIIGIYPTGSPYLFVRNGSTILRASFEHPSSRVRRACSFSIFLPCKKERFPRAVPPGSPNGCPQLPGKKGLDYASSGQYLQPAPELPPVLISYRNFGFTYYQVPGRYKSEMIKTYDISPVNTTEAF